ncbi:MAG: fatty acid desaturase [Gammaproteobacteria bacterium]|nr:fatty acid desaturase [Gammaproteobacteria bacterium]
MLNGILDLSGWGVLAAVLLMTHITIVSVTVYLHRHQAHRALDLHPALAHFFRLWLWLTTGMVTKEWTAIHRKHHARCETVDDPHSPQILGIRKVLWQGAELYRKESFNQETLDKYGHGTPNDWLERKIYSRYSGLGVALMLVFDLMLFGVIGISVWAIQMIWIPFFAAGVINGLGHFRGYRNFETTDAATNISPWGILIGGEELHNNHHAFPSSARLSSKPWEFDIGWMYIRLFEKLRLAKVKKIAILPVIVADKQAVDIETLKAIITHRFHVLASYCREVIAPVLKDELKMADSVRRPFLKRAQRLLVREQILLDEVAQNRLNALLQRSHALQTVYRHKMELQQLWRRSAQSQEALVQALQEWCQQAEATGIRALQEFSRNLKGYSLATA